MIWFWSRDSQELQFETRYDNDTFEFVVIIRYPDGRSESERFRDILGFRRRLLTLEQRFEAEHWTPVGTPLIDPEGFPTRRLDPELLGDGLVDARNRSPITRRTYTMGARAFQVTLLKTSSWNESAWTIESVIETTRGSREIAIAAGMHSVVAPTEEAAFARACDRIDKWLKGNP